MCAVLLGPLASLAELYRQTLAAVNIANLKQDDAGSVQISSKKRIPGAFWSFWSVVRLAENAPGKKKISMEKNNSLVLS